MKIKRFSLHSLCITLLWGSISLDAAILDDLIEKIQHKPVQKYHKRQRSQHTLSEEAQWQTALRYLGYYHGKIDGDLYTQRSFDAITAFHIKHEEVSIGFLEEADKQYLSEVYQAVSLDRYMTYSGKNKKKNNKKLQAALTLQSLYEGKIDGSFGKRSKHAFALYKAQFENNTTAISETDIKERLITDAREKVQKRLDRLKEAHYDPVKYMGTEEKIDL